MKGSAPMPQNGHDVHANHVAMSSTVLGQDGLQRQGHGRRDDRTSSTFSEPRLLILTDPRTDHQPIKESALGNIPTITFCDTDSPVRYVDIGIPANNKRKQSIGCFWFVLVVLLARMVLQMRGTIRPGHKWDVMVDLFFYRDPEEAKELRRKKPRLPLSMV
ncbi:hypothetical protein PR202_ga29178 [Eleusine coracana subsp. coracana]|uniref:Uncharacterized protein n=1 Tax=Eleusine coracana subsp. coracana TaxID=191504 RepID=A0AAV5DMA1_ELECO|nr:hypothetical protein PR202_ga29178 [Eleusine coracana subsp. coracana]